MSLFRIAFEFPDLMIDAVCFFLKAGYTLGLCAGRLVGWCNVQAQVRVQKCYKNLVWDGSCRNLIIKCENC